MQPKQGILIESGTNELEFVEFTVGTSKFGINVIKVKEIMNPAVITVIPHAHPAIEGIMNIRGEVIPVVSLSKVLNISESTNPANDKFIVCEFNNIKIVFHVHSVSRIHRVSWETIEKPDQLYTSLDTEITGVIHLQGEMILLLDYEKIIVDINPRSGITTGRLAHLGKRERSNKKIVIAEDSALLRRLIKETLAEAGYSLLTFFEDGKEALTYLESLTTVTDEVQLVITDIEMPKMDGHYLTKMIKENQKLNPLPVIIFSSLITDDLRHKGEKVGADAQVSKPEIDKLVLLIDEYII